MENINDNNFNLFIDDFCLVKKNDYYCQNNVKSQKLLYSYFEVNEGINIKVLNTLNNSIYNGFISNNDLEFNNNSKKQLFQSLNMKNTKVENDKDDYFLIVFLQFTNIRVLLSKTKPTNLKIVMNSECNNKNDFSFHLNSFEINLKYKNGYNESIEGDKYGFFRDTTCLYYGKIESKHNKNGIIINYRNKKNCAVNFDATFNTINGNLILINKYSALSLMSYNQLLINDEYNAYTPFTFGYYIIIENGKQFSLINISNYCIIESSPHENFNKLLENLNNGDVILLKDLEHIFTNDMKNKHADKLFFI